MHTHTPTHTYVCMKYAMFATVYVHAYVSSYSSPLPLYSLFLSYVFLPFPTLLLLLPYFLFIFPLSPLLHIPTFFPLLSLPILLPHPPSPPTSQLLQHFSLCPSLLPPLPLPFLSLCVITAPADKLGGRVLVKVPSPPQHLALSANQQVLSVVARDEAGKLTIFFYKLQHFFGVSAGCEGVSCWVVPESTISGFTLAKRFTSSAIDSFLHQ